MNYKNILLAFVLCTSGLVNGQNPSYNVNAENVILDGYDVVSYFSETPIMGTKKYSCAVDGVTFYFTSRENLEEFKSNPTRYTPKYGGYCAFGLAKAGKKFPVDYTSYKIIDEELYLFFVGPIQGKQTDTQQLWNLEEETLLPAAEAAWEEIEDR